MTAPKKPLSPNAKESQHDQRTALVKAMLAKESAASDAKTARLRALRLAHEAEAPPVPVKSAPVKKAAKKRS